MVSCYLGIDVGTQGLTALLVESSQSPSSSSSVSPSASSSASSSASVSLNVIAKGEGSYDFVPNLDDGCYEQEPNDWDNALIKALKKIQNDVNVAGTKINIKSICVTGQMHGCVMIDRHGESIGTARLWCDSRNQEEVRTVHIVTTTHHVKFKTDTVNTYVQVTLHSHATLSIHSFL
jgi:sugar (pentulose or hexulose) kinase